MAAERAFAKTGEAVGLLSKIAKSQRTRGFLGTCALILRMCFEKLGGHRLRRKFKNAGDWLYDLRNGVDTRGFMAPVAEHAKAYQSSSEGVFRAAMSKLKIDHREFTFIDFGSGKGKALLMARRYPFREVVGVELDATLVAISQSNLRRYRGVSSCGPIRSVLGDAAAFDIPSGPLVCYFANPFDDVLMRRVLSNIRGSLVPPVSAGGGAAWLVYYYPWHREAFTQPWIIPIEESTKFAIYRMEPPVS